ncbi:uncharacterized protein Dana_GF14915 [Drosophila ananassae]|uniref:N-acetylgalactosaminide beta-1,3-galactosyltransferase n=1 Tax=Drosophila ananassae TaxID=7217 RepID=B3MLA5_DROAN|nr:glycoprotein-N-acetylgalactosamine 3-beta-galactosyltransferase 1 [Drosophila ananassae]EDV30694.1 uncharacterized protein Dana_GF14915 [Drosophila ananassae]
MEPDKSLFMERNSHLHPQHLSGSSSRPVLFLLMGIGIGYIITQVVLLPIIDFKSYSNHTEKRSPLDIDLSEKVRVLCYVSTKPQNHKEGAKAVLRTWGRRCNKLIFFTSKVDPALPGSVALSDNSHLRESWNNTKNALKYLYHHHLSDADWFLEADDQTFVLVENLRYMLYPFSPEMPIYFGSPGTAMSRAALRKVVEVGLPNPTKCEEKDTGETLGRFKECLDNADVEEGNSRDSKGRRRMYLIDPQARSNTYLRYDSKFWYWKYIALRTQDGIFAWSDYPVSFHYVNHRYIHGFEYMIYRLRSFGRKIPDESLPSQLVPHKLRDKKRHSGENEFSLDYAY